MDLRLGRVTYQEWAQYWPASTDEPFAGHINRVPKYVVSRTLAAAPWGPSGSATLLKGSLADAIATVKGLPGGTIGVHGSPTLVGSLLQADLLDELRLEIYPVVAGSGARLFHDGQATKHLQLVESRVARSGRVPLSWRRHDRDRNRSRRGAGRRHRGNGGQHLPPVVSARAPAAI